MDRNGSPGNAKGIGHVPFHVDVALDMAGWSGAGEASLIDAQVGRLDAQRRVGEILLSVPITGLVLLIASGTGLPRVMLLNQILGWVGMVLLVVGLPTVPAGIALRLVSGYRIRRLCGSATLDVLGSVPPLRAGDRLGGWRLVRTDRERMVLAHSLGPALLTGAMRTGLEAIMLGVLAVSMVGAIRSGMPGAWIACAVLAVFATAVSASLSPSTLEVAHPGGRPSISYGGLRVWGLLTLGRWHVPFDDLEDLAWTDTALLIHSSGGVRRIAGFGRGPLGQWQVRRLCAAILGGQEGAVPAGDRG